MQTAMNTVKLFLGYKSFSLGTFSCQEELPKGKKNLLYKIIEEENPNWMQDIFYGACLNGSELPTYGVMAVLSEECLKQIEELATKIKKRFPDSELWVTTNCGWRRSCCTVGHPLLLEPDIEAKAVSLCNNLLYNFYKERNIDMRAFLLKRKNSLMLWSIWNKDAFPEYADWFDVCHDLYVKIRQELSVGMPMFFRVALLKNNF